MLSRLVDSSSYIFKSLVVDTVTAVEAIASEIAIEKDRERQYRQRVMLKAQAYLAAAGTEVSDAMIEQVARASGITPPDDSMTQARIDSLQALTPSPDEVVRYVAFLTYTAKDEKRVRREDYWEVTFDPKWQVIDALQY